LVQPVHQTMQMWPQQQQLASGIPGQPRSAIYLTSLTGGQQAQMPMTSSGTPLVFASPSLDGSGQMRAPVPTVATSQLGNPLNGPNTSFIMAVNSASSDVLPSNVPTFAVPVSNAMFNGTASTLTSSSSTSLVLDQPSSTLPIPKIISLATIPSTQVVDEASISPVVHSATQQTAQTTAQPASVFTTKSLTDLVKETDPHLQLDEETEELLMALSEEFIDTVADKAIRMASHRGSSIVEAKDIKFCFERDWNIFIPGYPTTDRALKRPFVLQAHKQRLAIAKKQIKRT